MGGLTREDLDPLANICLMWLSGTVLARCILVVPGRPGLWPLILLIAGGVVVLLALISWWPFGRPFPKVASDLAAGIGVILGALLGSFVQSFVVALMTTSFSL